MKNMYPNTHRKGQVLVEALISITIITVGILGVFALLSQSIGSAKFIANQYIASNLAAEGVEMVRSQVAAHVFASQPWGWGVSDGGWEIDYNGVLEADLSRFLFLNPTTGVYSYDSGSPTLFKRSIKINTDPDNNGTIDQIQVNAIVDWRQKGGQFSVNVEDRLFDWTP